MTNPNGWRLVARYGDVYCYEKDGVRWYRAEWKEAENG